MQIEDSIDNNKSKRQERFAQKEKYIKKIKSWQRFSNCEYFGSLDEKDKNRLIGIHKKTRKTCSCHMCGNPRKFFNEKTIQEKRQLEGYKFLF